MKTKQIFTLTVVLLLLILGIVIKKSQSPSDFVTQAYTPLDLSFDSAKVSSVVLKRGNSAEPQVHLKKDGQRWQVANFSAARVEENRVESFFSTLQKARGERRGSGKEIFPDFGITDEEGLHVVLSGDDGKEVLALVIGTRKAGAEALFIRKKNGEDIYLAEAPLFNFMGIQRDPASAALQPDQWVSRALAEYDASKVNRLEIKNFQKGAAVSSLILEKDGSDWKFNPADQPFAPSNEKVTAYLEEAKAYMRQKIYNPEAMDYGFDKPNFQVVMNFSDAPALTITAGKPETEIGEAYYIQVSDESIIGLLSKYYLENLAAGPQRFFPDNPLAVETGKTEKLVVYANQAEMIFSPRQKRTDALDQYLEDLKNVHFGEPSNQKVKFGKYWIEIQKEGEEPVAYDFADVSSKDKKDYVFQKRGTTHLFSIAPSLFTQIFETPSHLAEPASK